MRWLAQPERGDLRAATIAPDFGERYLDTIYRANGHRTSATTYWIPTKRSLAPHAAKRTLLPVNCLQLAEQGARVNDGERHRIARENSGRTGITVHVSIEHAAPRLGQAVDGQHRRSDMWRRDDHVC